MFQNLKKWGPFLVLTIIAILGLILDGIPKETNFTYNSSDISWMLISSALVLIMTPGLAFFYGGMVNRKNLIATMLQSFICMGVISILWVVVGYSLAFGEPWIVVNGYSILGNPSTHFMFQGVLDGDPWKLAPTIPLLLFALFQLKFAVITPALITGSFSDRIKFTSYILFSILFSILIYTPLAHMTWHYEGLLFKLGVLDFAGGTVVHISAGTAALAAALFLGKRKIDTETEPANIPYVLIGTGLLWFGWFGFNAGSSLSSGLLAVNAYAVTNIAAACAGLTWILFDVLRGKKPSALGFCIGVVVGLVAITPAAGFVTIPVSIFIGFIASLISNIATDYVKKSNKIDDTLDVFPCHGIGGMVGMLLTGIFATTAVNVAVVDQGIFYGDSKLFFLHLGVLVGVFIFSFVGSFILLKLTNLITPLRVTEEEERIGLDYTQHGESYVFRVEKEEGIKQ
jgi:Amt family ammonium transporter